MKRRDWLMARSFESRLVLIAVVGVALRALYIFVVARHPPGTAPPGDWSYYHGQANLIADGFGFADPGKFHASGRLIPAAFHPPLYPAVLSLISKGGATSEGAHRSAGLLFGAGTIALCGLLGRRVASPRAGLVAAASAALYPLLVATDGALLSESLFVLLVAGALVLAYRTVDRPTVFVAGALGATIGLAALTRSEAVLLLPLLALPALWRTPSMRWRGLAAACVAWALVVGPWLARNWIVFDRPTPIALSDASLAAGANCRPAYYGPDIGLWRGDCVSPIRYENQSLQGARWRGEAWRYARDHAGRLPLVIGVRILRGFDLYQPRRGVQYTEGRHVRVEQAGIAVYYLFLPLAAFGVVLLRRRAQPLFVLLSVPAMALLTFVLGYGVTRYRAAAEVPIIVLAAVSIEYAAARFEERRGRS